MNSQIGNDVEVMFTDSVDTSVIGGEWQELGAKRETQQLIDYKESSLSFEGLYIDKEQKTGLPCFGAGSLIVVKEEGSNITKHYECVSLNSERLDGFVSMAVDAKLVREFSTTYRETKSKQRRVVRVVKDLFNSEKTYEIN